MAMKSNDRSSFLIPMAPSDLCFDRDEFVKDGFSVDKFIQDHRNQVQLETLRDDLGVYLKILRSAMIELINKDYADFVNLSSNLIGLDKAIAGLQVPLGQLKEEVMHVRAAIEETKAELNGHLEERKVLRQKKSNLQNVMQIVTCLNKVDRLLRPSEGQQGSGGSLQLEPDLLERVASEFNQLQFCVDKCPHEYLTDIIKKRIEEISNILDHSTERMFTDSLRRESIPDLCRCLRVYASLDRIHRAEHLFQQRVVRPYMDQAISQQSLNSDPQGLRGLYARVLNFVPACMREVAAVTLEAGRGKGQGQQVKGFNFMVNSVWVEVASKVQERLAVLFSPGNPDLFFERYTQTMDFLHQFEVCCGTESGVKLLRSHPSYKAFLDCWNLPVYFQIRFQEIGGALELSMYELDQDSSLSLTSHEGASFHHPVSRTLWKCIHDCWASGIYLPGMAHRFWKLTLQLLSRYRTWICDTLEKLKADHKPSRKKGELNLLVCLFADVKQVVNGIPGLTDIVLEKLSTFEFDCRIINEGMSEAGKTVESTCPLVAVEITSLIQEDCCVQLRQVGDIPRLFRRTNRDPPTKACGYVVQVTAPLSRFVKVHGEQVGEKQVKQWVASILGGVTKQYYSSVSDVLTSIQRMEESLRRLKKARDKTSASAMDSGRGMTDDDKIRRQLAIDVEAFIIEAKKMGVDKSDVDKLPELWDLVDAANKTASSEP